MVASATPIDGLKAHAYGLANQVVPFESVLPTAMALARSLAAWSPIAMATTKRTFYRAMDLSLSQALEVGRDANIMMRGFQLAKTQA